MSGRRLVPLNQIFEEKEGEISRGPSKISSIGKMKQYDPRFEKKLGGGGTDDRGGRMISPRGKPMAGGSMLQVPSLSGIGALRLGNNDSSNSDLNPTSARGNGNMKVEVGGMGLSVAGRNAHQQGAQRRSEANGKAKMLLKEVEDLYQGFQQNKFAGESKVKGQSEDMRIRHQQHNIINEPPAKFPDPYVEDEFGDESVDTIMSDTSDHSELTPRGDRGPHVRRQNGPRGYGQGKIGGAKGGNQSSSAKPTKFKLQGGQRPLKISVKERQGVMELSRNPSENIGTLVAQSYNQPSAEGGNNGLMLLQGEKGRNRSLPTLHK